VDVAWEEYHCTQNVRLTYVIRIYHHGYKMTACLKKLVKTIFHKNYVRETGREETRGRPRCRWEDNVRRILGKRIVRCGLDSSGSR
jgi:hypothetical protein